MSMSEPDSACQPSSLKPPPRPHLIHIINAVPDVGAVGPYAVGFGLHERLPALPALPLLLADRIDLDFRPLFHRHVLKGLEDAVFVYCSDAHDGSPLGILARVLRSA